MILHPEGFRDYDARWRTPEQIDAAGMERVGLALAAMARQRHGDRPAIVIGHDLRREAEEMHRALRSGLVAGGAHVLDCGLALSPVVYHHWLFRRIDAGAVGCAMVTASHNPDGWTGVKMGLGQAPLTFAAEDMKELRDLALHGDPAPAPGGSATSIPGAASKWMKGIATRDPVRHIRAVIACGNGTAAAFVPSPLEAISVDVVPLGCTPDWTFPLHHPNPDALPMQEAMSHAVIESGAEIGIGFDGDGDRIGVVDGKGRVIPGDRLGLIMARLIARRSPGARFLVDIKSTGLWADDPVLAAHGATVEFGPTGHSHMKRRLHAMREGREGCVVAGFERSGHVFLGPPYGHGFDDAPAAAIRLLEFLGHEGSIVDLADALPTTFATPAHEPACADAVKHAVARRLCERLGALTELGGRSVASHVEAGGLRAQTDGGSWALIRASSNTPNLVVMAESIESAQHRDAILADLTTLLETEPEVGPLI